MSEIYTLAIDQAETCGYSLWQGNQLIKHDEINLNMNSNTDEELIHNIKKWVDNIIKSEKVAIVVLEDTFLGNNPKVYKKLTKLLGVLENYCYEKEILQITVEAKKWKGHCGIKGRKREEQKANTIKYVKEKFGIDAKENEADSIGIGDYFVSKLLPKLIVK